MKDLIFKVKGQRISLASPVHGLVPGTQGYLRAVFHVDETWDGCAIIAVFSNHDSEQAIRLGKDFSCMIPDETLTRTFFHVQVVGIKPGFRIQTQQLRVRQGG